MSSCKELLGMVELQETCFTSRSRSGVVAAPTSCPEIGAHHYSRSVTRAKSRTVSLSGRSLRGNGHLPKRTTEHEMRFR